MKVTLCLEGSDERNVLCPGLQIVRRGGDDGLVNLGALVDNLEVEDGRMRVEDDVVELIEAVVVRQR